MRLKTVLTIAGSDPSAGAGIAADLKTCAALKVYGVCAITAITAQNTRGVAGVYPLDPVCLRAQIETLFADIKIDAIKIGMLATGALADCVYDCLAAHPDIPIVLDPVLSATTGQDLLEHGGMGALKRLLSRATLVTPNLMEAARLLQCPLATTLDAMAEQGKALQKFGCAHVLIKGGHMAGAQSGAICTDVLISGQGRLHFSSKRQSVKNCHGTGCTLSCAIAACVARGEALTDAIAKAKAYVDIALRHADDCEIGGGRGPLHHFAEFWQE